MVEKAQSYNLNVNICEYNHMVEDAENWGQKRSKHIMGILLKHGMIPLRL